MAQVKLTKGELKKQRDALKQYERYLPTLQLKKQQLQIEISHQLNLIEERKAAFLTKEKAASAWSGFLVEPFLEKSWFIPNRIDSGVKNIAGVDIPVFEKAEFAYIEYDLFLTPLWVDTAIDILRVLVSLREEIAIVEKGVAILKQELRVTTQRVNLFEKIKIPQAKEAIRLIKIYIGDQMANAVGRSKIAKAKIEEGMLEEIIV